MATPAAAPEASGPKDKTFRNYNTASAAAYAQYRPPYPEKFVQAIIDTHVSTGGGLDLLLDVGCGPGTATRSVAPHFAHAVAVDPGESMIATARSKPTTARSGSAVRYEIGSAEALSSIPGLAPASVDMVVAATAAHWFEIAPFYAECARVLKPGGSIAVWCSGSYYADPDTTPNLAKVAALLEDFELNVLGPFTEPGNRMGSNLYRDLALPWDCVETAEDEESKALLRQFRPEEYVRTEYTRETTGVDEELLRKGKATFEQIQMAFGTASSVTRWREANKEKVEKGELEDCAVTMVRKIKEAISEVEEGKGREWLGMGTDSVTMIIKKQK